MQSTKLNYAPHTYLAVGNSSGEYLLSIITPVIAGKVINFATVNYMTTKTKIVGTVADDSSSTEEYIKDVFTLNISNTSPTKVELEIINGSTSNYKSYDKYADADVDSFNINDGIANNCPHLFLDKTGTNNFHPKAILPLDGYKFNGLVDLEILVTSPQNGICECTVKLHEDVSVNQMLLSSDINSSTYLEEGIINGNFIVFVDLISAAEGPITKKKNKKVNKIA